MSLNDAISRLSPLRPPCSEAAIAVAEASLGPLPADYKQFMRQTNGYEGFPHPDVYLVILRLESLVGYDIRGTQVMTHSPGYILFASDGGGTGYFFDPSNPGPVRMMDLISDWRTDFWIVGGSFTEFLLRQLAGSDSHIQ